MFLRVSLVAGSTNMSPATVSYEAVEYVYFFWVELSHRRESIFHKNKLHHKYSVATNQSAPEKKNRATLDVYHSPAHSSSQGGPRVVAKYIVPPRWPLTCVCFTGSMYSGGSVNLTASPQWAQGSKRFMRTHRVHHHFFSFLIITMALLSFLVSPDFFFSFAAGTALAFRCPITPGVTLARARKRWETWSVGQCRMTVRSQNENRKKWRHRWQSACWTITRMWHRFVRYFKLYYKTKRK